MPRSSMPRPKAKRQGTRPVPRRYHTRPGPSRLMRARRGRVWCAPSRGCREEGVAAWGCEDGGTPWSAPEHLRGNHPQGAHHDRIAHRLDEPGLGAHLLLHHVRMLPPRVIGHPRVLVRPHLRGVERG
jgi:hypothetical protein